MANGGDPFSTSTMRNALRDHRFAAAREPIAEENPAVPPPPRSTAPRETNLTEENQSLLNSFRSDAVLTPQESEMRSQSLFNLMTTNSEEGEDAADQFKEMIAKLDRSDLQRMASLLTSDSDYFLDIARNKNGSERLQELLGKYNDVDSFFSAAILRRFLDVMTNKNASYVATRGMQVFNQEKKMAMYGHILYHAIRLARDQHGCIVLQVIIKCFDDFDCRNHLLGIVAFNALCLSNDAYGNFVVQRVLKLNNLYYTRNIAVNLRGHCVQLSFRKHGSYIVEKLLDTDESRVVVVMELLECGQDRLMRLARSEYGTFVVEKALRVAQDEMFWDLVDKLMPFRHLLGRFPGSNIAAILDSIH